MLICPVIVPRCLLFFLALLVTCLLPAREAAAYTILTPPGTDIIIQARRPVATMVIRATGAEVERLQVTMTTGGKGGGERILPAGRWQRQGGMIFHYRLPLRPGDNTFVVEPGSRRLAIRYRPVRTLGSVDFEDPAAYVFHRLSVVPSACAGCHTGKGSVSTGADRERFAADPAYAPLCFSCHRRLSTREKWLHGPSANVLCLGCHRIGTRGTRVTIPSARVNELCFGCHVNKKKLLQKKYVHGPYAIGDCTVCHDPHGDAYKYQLWADGRAGLCVGCHSDKKRSLRKSLGFFSHGIIEGSGCIACHDPHASDNRFQLYRPINQLCVSCHVGLQGISKGHPVGNHPLQGVPDPRRRGRTFACSSCHNPHGSRYRYLLIGDVLGGHVCSKCHH
ncbi:cytochrome c3 family protein [Thermodesulfobacteriota bacterium B35]